MSSINNVKKAYSNKDWDDRIAYYVGELSQMTVPETPLTTDLKRLTAKIDGLLGEALLDLSYIKSKKETIEFEMKNLEKEMFSLIKENPTIVSPNVSVKPSIDEIKSYIVQYIKNKPYGSATNKVNIYKAFIKINRRYIFINDTVLKMLYEKKSAIISDNSMLKMEFSLDPDNVK